MYTAKTLIDFSLITMVVMFTPGPNNIMLMNTSLSFGYRKAIPAALGVLSGTIILFHILAYALGSLFEVIRFIQPFIGLLGSSYLLYLAYRLYSSQAGKKEEDEQGGKSQAIGYFSVFIFQFINPKAIIGYITIISAFLNYSSNYLLSLAPLVAINIALGAISVSIWMFFGSLLNRLIHDPRKLKLLNTLMAFVLAVLAGNIFYEAATQLPGVFEKPS